MANCDLGETRITPSTLNTLLSSSNPKSSKPISVPIPSTLSILSEVLILGK